VPVKFDVAMPLLPEDKLIWSPIVANCRMNRERNANGINSYEQELGFDPIAFLAARIAVTGNAAWLDVCCGEGRALHQTAQHFYQLGLQNSIRLKGIDLLDTFEKMEETITCLQFETASVVDWMPTQSYDLITCIHGLHYVGDKLKALEKMAAALSKDGLFWANFDVNSILINGPIKKNQLQNLFSNNSWVYNNRRKQLKRQGPATLHFGLHYLGADDQAGPNYTGQEAVTSYYTSP
jgi:SAM-dependent methyltransferase